MKVERKESEFQPVVITLESQFEVDVICELMGNVGGTGKARNITEGLYGDLYPFITDKNQPNKYFDCNIITKS